MLVLFWAIVLISTALNSFAAVGETVGVGVGVAAAPESECNSLKKLGS
jgi:hypothetical protein